MFFALTEDGKRIHIHNTHVKDTYYCPDCGEELIVRKGEKNRPHFAHKRRSNCIYSTDTDAMSVWHTNWQSRFPQDCQEILLKNDQNQRCIADVFLEKTKTVIEFQHSNITTDQFDKRNKFYTSLGYHVVWLFDFSSQYNSRAIDESYNDEDKYIWRRPKTTFNNFKLNQGVELFFQFENLPEDEETFYADTASYYMFENHTESPKECAINLDGDHIARLKWIAPNGIEHFMVDNPRYTVSKFLQLFQDDDPYSKKYSLDDLYDELISIGRKDHTVYFTGCPLSKSHMAASGTIDLSPEEHPEYRFCNLCKYSGKYQDTCTYRVENLHIPNNAKIEDFSLYNSGFLKQIIYSVDNKKNTIKLLDAQINFKIAKSIPELWKDVQPQVAVFKNLKTLKFAKICKNPLDTITRHGKCYGYISNDQFRFNGESCEIYYATSQQWIMVWHK